MLFPFVGQPWQQGYFSTYIYGHHFYVCGNNVKPGLKIIKDSNNLPLDYILCIHVKAVYNALELKNTSEIDHITSNTIRKYTAWIDPTSGFLFVHVPELYFFWLCVHIKDLHDLLNSGQVDSSQQECHKPANVTETFPCPISQNRKRSIHETTQSLERESQKQRNSESQQNSEDKFKFVISCLKHVKTYFERPSSSI